MILGVTSAISVTPGCSLFPSPAPEPVEPQVEFESLTRLKKGEPAPFDGYILNDNDWQKLLKILAEIERETSN